MDCGSAALADAATEFCSNEFQVVAQEPEQWGDCGNIHLADFTVLNFSYANLSIAKGNEAFVYCNTKNRDETFFIQGKDSITKHYIKNSTLSETIEDAAKIKLAEAIHFNLIFDTKKNLKTFDLKENMKGSDWSFHDINIPKKQYLTNDIFEQYKNNEFHETRMKLRRGEFTRAKDDIDEKKHTLKNNELLEQMSAIASYSLGLYSEAIESIKNTIKLNPTNAGYYADLYNLYTDIVYSVHVDPPFWDVDPPAKQAIRVRA